MKKTKILLLAFIAIFTLAGCGSSNDDFVPTDGGGTSSGGNTNMNMVTDGMPTVVANAIGGLEFPKLKNNGTSYTIVHMDGNDITYSTEWDDAKKAQRWSCYTFNTKNSKQNVSGRYEPTDGSRKYPFDTDLKALYNVVDFTSDPYPTQAGFDHGHICPNADRFYNLHQRNQTYYMTNMQPQYSKFNQSGGAWFNMEIELRKLAPKINTDTLFVVKGGTIDKVGNDENIIEYRSNGAVSATPRTGYIPIPKYFFVAVLNKKFDKSKNGYTYEAFGWWFPHEETTMAKSKLSDYVVNIKTLEEKTGIDFFCNLPDETENKIEKVSVEAIKQNWGFK